MQRLVWYKKALKRALQHAGRGTLCAISEPPPVLIPSHIDYPSSRGHETKSAIESFCKLSPVLDDKICIARVEEIIVRPD